MVKAHVCSNYVGFLVHTGLMGFKSCDPTSLVGFTLPKEFWGD